MNWHFYKAITSTFCLLLGFVFLQSVYTQHIRLTEEQEKIYKKSCLSVEIKQKNDRGKIGNPNTWRHWQAYQGLNSISEEQIFRIAGSGDKAQKARRYRKNATSLFTTGIVLVIGGAATMIASQGMMESDSFVPLLIGGGTLALAGLWPLAVGESRLKRNLFPYSTADRVAQEYNQKLLIRVQGEF